MSSLTITKPTFVQFNGSRILAVMLHGREYVAIKPICEALGLDWSAQFRSIKRDSILSEGIAVTAIPTDSGAQETICLPLDMLNGWLFGVSEKRVNPAIVDKLLHYKRECYRALHAHFLAKHPPAPVQAVLPLKNKALTTIEEEANNVLDALVHIRWLAVRNLNVKEKQQIHELANTMAWNAAERIKKIAKVHHGA